MIEVSLKTSEEDKVDSSQKILHTSIKKKTDYVTCKKFKYIKDLEYKKQIIKRRYKRTS